LGFEKLNGGLRHGQPARHIHPSLLIPTILLHNNRLANDDHAPEIHCDGTAEEVFMARLHRLKKSLYEGHGFSRAVLVCLDEGFSP
jgi:hypothetical protein